MQMLAHNHSAHFLWAAAGRWFAVRLDFVTALVISVVGSCVLLFRDSLDPTLAALALTYALQMTSLFQWGFRLWAEVSNHFISVERFLAYTKLPQEAAATQGGDGELHAAAWPVRGAVVFAAVAMRYQPELPLVLDGVSFAIDGGTKAALVGRTGAGKSSVALVLARVCEAAAGRVTIDGVDVASVGLKLLRGSLTFIQQDTLLFSGTCSKHTTYYLLPPTHSLPTTHHPPLTCHHRSSSQAPSARTSTRSESTARRRSIGRCTPSILRGTPVAMPDLRRPWPRVATT